MNWGGEAEGQGDRESIGREKEGQAAAIGISIIYKIVLSGMITFGLDLMRLL